MRITIENWLTAKYEDVPAYINGKQIEYVNDGVNGDVYDGIWRVLFVGEDEFIPMANGKYTLVDIADRASEMTTLDWLKYIGLVDERGEAITPSVEPEGQALVVAGQTIREADVLRLCQQRENFKRQLMRETAAHCHTQQLLRRYEQDFAYHESQPVFFVTAKGYDKLDDLERGS